MTAYRNKDLKKKDQEKMDEMQREIDEAEMDDDQPDAAEAAQDGVETQDTPESADEATKEESVEDLKLVIKEQEDRFTRLRADFENFRRRNAKEREELSSVVTQDLLKAMLPVLDNFDRAMAVEQKDNDAFQQGVEMLYKQFRETLKNAGLEAIDAQDQKFDPNFHQAVMRKADPDREDDTVSMVLQPGYQVKGHVIRPAMVQVVSNA